MKTQNAHNKFIFLIIIFGIAILFEFIRSNDASKNYESINISENAYMKVPKWLYEKGKIERFNDYVYVKNNYAKVLGIETPSKGIDKAILDEMNITEKKINEIGIVDSEKQLQQVFHVDEKNIIDTNEFYKPSFRKYMLRYSLEQEEIVILVHAERERSVVQIIKAKKDKLTENEIEKIYTGEGFYTVKP